MMLSDNQESKMTEIIGMIQDAVGAENAYLDVIAQDYVDLPELKKVNDQILDL